MTGVTFYCIATKGTRNIPAFWCQSADLIGEIAACLLFHGIPSEDTGWTRKIPIYNRQTPVK